MVYKREKQDHAVRVIYKPGSCVRGRAHWCLPQLSTVGSQKSCGSNEEPFFVRSFVRSRTDQVSQSSTFEGLLARLFSASSEKDGRRRKRRRRSSWLSKKSARKPSRCSFRWALASSSLRFRGLFPLSSSLGAFERTDERRDGRRDGRVRFCLRFLL